jgi:type I restriction enzyme, S subunit
VSRYPLRPLGDAISLDIDEVPIDPGTRYPIAGVYGFGRGLFHREPILGSQTGYKKLCRLHAGHIVMSRLKAFEGAISYIPEQFDGSFLSSEFPTFEVKEKIADIRYVSHICGWPEFWGLLQQGSKGIGARRERVNAGRLLSIKVPLPDLDEQCRVANKVDTMLGRVETVEFFRRQVAELQTNLGESAVSSALNLATVRVHMDDVLELVREPVEIDLSSHYKALGVRSFGKGIIRYPGVIGSELSKLNYFTFPKNALILSNIKAWEGAISVTSVEDTSHVASNRFLFYLPRDDRANVSYLRHYLLSRDGLAKISAASPGAADRNRTLGIKRFESIEFPLPPRPVQDKVARVLDALTDRLWRSHSSRILESIRPAILNAAFTGQL